MLSPYYWWRFWLNNDTMLDVKAWIAAIGGLILLWYCLADYLPSLRRGTKIRDALLATMGVISFCAWYNFGRWHFDPFIHYHEFYHYYLGAKYPRELKYTRLYQCTLDAENEYRPFLHQALIMLPVRDLNVNDLVHATSLMDNPDDCKSHFTPERWRDFMRDSDFFRSASSWGFWSYALMDNGFNASPVWVLFAGPLANSGPINDSLIHWLGYLDPALEILMWCFCLWAFGWRATCCALIFWGTNLPARYYWNGGAFLRMDWLFFTIAGLCLMKKERPAASGVFLTIATLLRVFPGFVVVPLILKVAINSWRARKLVLSRLEKRFAAGAIVTLLVLVSLSTWYCGGPQIWSGFVHNSEKHLSTALTNNMGLKAIYSWAPSTRAKNMKQGWAFEPFYQWKKAQVRNGERMRIPFLLTLAAFLALLAVAASKQEHWIAMALGCGLVLIAAELTCYYFSILLALALLWPRIRWAGVAAAAASLLSIVIPNIPNAVRYFNRYSRWEIWDDDSFIIISGVWVIWIVALTYWLARPLWKKPAGDAKPADKPGDAATAASP